MLQWELRGKDGSPLVAADPDGLLAAFLPTAGADTNKTGSLLDPHSTGVGELDWARSITLTLVDANAGITQVKVYLTGENVFGVLIQETLTLIAAGVTESNYAFSSVTSVIYHVSGVVNAPDTLELGWGDKLGLPATITSLDQIRTKRFGSAIDAGTISIPTFQTWEPTVGNIPDGATAHFFETW
jgi:hypothetical protein